MLTTKPNPVGQTQLSLQAWLNRIVRVFATIAFMDALLFGIAGRLDWWAAWVFSLLYFAFLLGFLVWTSPALVQERKRMAPNVKTWDKIIVPIYSALAFSVPIIAALDAGRFRWAEMPIIWQVIGFIGILPCGAWILWAARTNAYLSSYARIQDDRGQQVITTGPYRYIRHPMYAALIPFILDMALVLGSWWALVPGGLVAILLTIRTALEDRMLQRELPGYKEYAQRVRYRLVPHVW